MLRLISAHVFAVFLFAAPQLSLAEQTGTSLQEYAAMDAQGQRNVIFKEKNRIYDGVKEKYLRDSLTVDGNRLYCVAGLFDFDTETGIKQYSIVTEFLRRVTAENRTSSAETFVKYLIENHFCPGEKAASQ